MVQRAGSNRFIIYSLVKTLSQVLGYSLNAISIFDSIFLDLYDYYLSPVLAEMPGELAVTGGANGA